MVEQWRDKQGRTLSSEAGLIDIPTVEYSGEDVMGFLGRLFGRKETPSQGEPAPQPEVRGEPEESPVGDWPYQFTLEQEIGPGSRRPHVPSGSSGLTLGPGYDMRDRSPEEIERDMVRIGLDAETAKRLAGASGLRGDAARRYGERLGVELSPEQEQRIFQYLVPQYEQRAISSLRRMGYDADWRDLDQAQRALLFDYSYSIGSLDSYPRFTAAVLSKDWDTALQEYQRFTRNSRGERIPLGRRNRDTRKLLEQLKQRG